MSENIDDATQLSDTTRLSDSTQLSDSTHLSDATHLASAPHTGTTPSTESAPQSVALPNLPQRPSQAPSEKPSPTTDAASIPAGDDSTVLKPRKGSTPAIPQQVTAQSQPQSQPQRQSSKQPHRHCPPASIPDYCPSPRLRSGISSSPSMRWSKMSPRWLSARPSLSSNASPH